MVGPHLCTPRRLPESDMDVRRMIGPRLRTPRRLPKSDMDVRRMVGPRLRTPRRLPESDMDVSLSAATPERIAGPSACGTRTSEKYGSTADDGVHRMGLPCLDGSPDAKLPLPAPL